ncbi:hypothetical protein [Psychrilyobacter sp.]|uniref:hypothetical protein n=1 Tax=Psychrilyobacter sp. TaxID=2586924 RepID=UPI00301B47FE
MISMFSGKFTGNRFKSGADRNKIPMEILKKRYVGGEITEDKYIDMKDKLRD